MKIPSISTPPSRVVSLVPSLTESMYELGLGASLVGVTDYCIYPGKIGKEVERVGGVKNPDIQKIISLQPDLILANQEENSRKPVEELIRSGLTVWVAFPKTCREVVEDLWSLVGIFHSESGGVKVRMLEMALEWAELAAADVPGRSYFCPIWQVEEGSTRSWMTFNQDTYSNDLLRIVGGQNVFADLDSRYPQVSLEDVKQMDPALILLPSEPFLFGPSDIEYFQKMFPGKDVELVDGSYVTWCGTRMGKALGELHNLFA